MNRKLKLPIFFFIAVVLIQVLSTPLNAQRRRPTTPTATPTRSLSTPATASDMNQVEQKNQALLQQIMNLQKERDFYKKKITSWTELQMNSAKATTEPKDDKEEKTGYHPGAMAAYYLPITPDILDTLIRYRSKARQSKGSASEGVDDDSLFHYAQRLAIMGRYNDARKSFEQLIRSRKVKDIHFLEYGKFLYKTGDYQRALEILSGVTGGNLELSVASYYKGRIYQQTNANTVAEIDFYRSRFLQPEFPGADAGKGFAFFQQGQLDSASEIFQRLVLRQSELSGEIYYGLARICEANDNYKQAVTYYQKSLVHDPLFVKSYVELAKALYETGDYQSCILFFQQVADVYSDRTMLVSYIAKSRYFLKQWDEALVEFQRIDNSPDGTKIKQEWISKIYYIKCLFARESGDHRGALDYFRKAREVNPDAYSWMMAALDDLGQIHAKDSNYNDALSYYSRLIRLNPADMETVLEIGKFYYYLGEIDEARKYFTHALNGETTGKQADFWLRQIHSIR
ncbi:tetratricopeptide repeat protein [bacterium]|nr:tetratricopeptide repeat protein [bacterium]MBU1635691.1 tetratricopeptide repeat protein [bacterium]MBU1874542.1 tetratricopeptide repeat protein [bacterium]